MGLILIASCKNCGFKQDIFFGSGMADYTRVCDVPGINRKTGEFVVANFLKADELKSEIIFYNEPLMYSATIGEDYHDWGDVLIQKKNNICPQCKIYSLEFINDGCFD